MSELIAALSRRVQEAVEALVQNPLAYDPPWVHEVRLDDWKNTPVIICGHSLFTQEILHAGAPVLGVVDDFKVGESTCGLPIISSLRMIELCQKQPEIICVNASLGENGWRYFREIAAERGQRLLEWPAYLRLVGKKPREAIYDSWQPTILSRFEEYLRLSEAWFDEASQEVLLKVLLFHLKGERAILLDLYRPAEWSYFRGGLFPLTSEEILVDGGANVGQTLHQFTRLVRGDFRAAHAFEPDRENVKKLRVAIGALPFRRPGAAIQIHEAALGRREEICAFDHRGNEGSRLLEGPARSGQTVQVTTIDAAVDDPVTMIKLDVEGHELAALHGAEATLRQHRPKLAVCVYHQPADVLEILRYLQSLDLGYRFSLRLHSASFFDLLLYAC